MGLIEGVMALLFGGGRNVVSETAEVFRENSDKGAARDLALSEATLGQFAAEFAHARKHWFDALIDGLNRVPRPAMAIGTIALFVSAMIDPVWFGARMAGLALVPEPLWWLLGAIVSFYFGARHQAKTQDFQRSIAQTLGRAGQVANSVRALEAGAGQVPRGDEAQAAIGPNPALAAWRQSHGG